MTDIVEAEIERLIALPYTRILVPDEEAGYSAEVLEFDGCFSAGDTGEEALANIEGAMHDWLEEELNAGHSIPGPMGLREFSGKLVLRLPESVHRRAAMRASREGVSLNQLLVVAVTHFLAEEDVVDRLGDALAERLRPSA
jgi:predicted RNase H-like HicB family nuclease